MASKLAFFIAACRVTLEGGRLQLAKAGEKRSRRTFGFGTADLHFKANQPDLGRGIFGGGMGPEQSTAAHYACRAETSVRAETPVKAQAASEVFILHSSFIL
jgi:hypothetical protein